MGGGGPRHGSPSPGRHSGPGRHHSPGRHSGPGRHHSPGLHSGPGHHHKRPHHSPGPHSGPDHHPEKRHCSPGSESGSDHKGRRHHHSPGRHRGPGGHHHGPGGHHHSPGRHGGPDVYHSGPGGHHHGRHGHGGGPWGHRGRHSPSGPSGLHLLRQHQGEGSVHIQVAESQEGYLIFAGVYTASCPGHALLCSSFAAQHFALCISGTVGLPGDLGGAAAHCCCAQCGAALWAP